MNYVNARDLFHGAVDSYDVVRRLKRYEKCGIKFIYIRNHNRKSLRHMMYIVVNKSKEGYSLQEIYHELYNQY